MDKQQQIQEMAYILHQSEHELTNDFDCEGDCANCWCSSKKRAEALYDKGYRKVITEKKKMQETKLTYEEIVKAYENLSTGYGSGVVGDLNTATLELLIEQKAEIERLTDLHDRTLKTLEELNAKNCGLECAKAELRKQVDELNEVIKCREDDCQKVVKDCQRLTVEKEQAVKDTAKEILQAIYEVKKVAVIEKEFDRLIAWLKDRYGVEVE